MTIEQLLEQSADELEALSDRDLLLRLEPLIKISKPRMVREEAKELFKAKKKPVKRKVKSSKSKSLKTLKGMSLKDLAKELDIDQDLIDEHKALKKARK